MRFCCYGVCGSRPVPYCLDDVVTICSRLVSELGTRAITKHNANPQSLLKLIQKDIPKQHLHSIFGVGGNTPSVELFPRKKSNSRIIFDLGTGISKVVTEKGTSEFHVFMTHFHYDHVQGLPFNNAFYNKDIKVNFYSPVKNFENIFHDLMKPPFFPVGMNDIMTPNLYFHELHGRSHIKIDDMKITWMPVPHPGGSYVYKVTNGEKSFCYFSDVNIDAKLFEGNKQNKEFLKSIDSMIIDASMDFVDSVTKRYWGHSNLYSGLNFCKRWGVKKVYMFHRDPTLTVRDINLIYQTALWYNKAIQSSAQVFLAQEDIEFAV